jgi:hypothetical protein
MDLFTKPNYKDEIRSLNNEKGECMKHLSGLVLSFVFLFNSTAVFAKISVDDIESKEQVLLKLRKVQSKEEKKKYKTNLVKAKNKQMKGVNNNFKKLDRKLDKLHKLSSKSKFKRARKLYTKYLKVISPMPNRDIVMNFSDKYFVEELKIRLNNLRQEQTKYLAEIFSMSKDYAEFLDILIADIENENRFASSNGDKRSPVSVIGTIALAVGFSILGYFVFCVVGALR